MHFITVELIAHGELDVVRLPSACIAGDCCDDGLPVKVPIQFRRIVLVQIDADFGILLTVRSVLGKTGSLEVLGFVGTEGICIEMPAFGHVWHKFNESEQFLRVPIFQYIIHGLLGDCGEDAVRLVDGNCLVNGIHEVFRGVVASQSQAAWQIYITVEFEDSLDKHGIFHDDAANLSSMY